jgi:ATP-dependent exoDNAse (exonuclease V) beta subunit
MSSNIHFISAGAGSGKTYRLTEKLERLLSDGSVAPAGVIATTFTRLAAGELKERVRQKLIECGRLNTANQMEQALIGTVNGVCGELLHRFAFEAGLPPDQTVLEEKQGDLLFFQAMEQALAGDRNLVREMNAVSHRLQIVDRKTLQWRQEVKTIVDAARANNQHPEDIRELGTTSADSLLTHFPAPTTRDLDQELLQAVSAALNGIDLEYDTTKATADYHTFIRGIQAALLKGTMTWAEWIKCSKSLPGAKSRDFGEAIQVIAADYDKHPRLREDIRNFAVRAFQIAADSLAAYQSLKARRGLIDFVDQEQQLYNLLDNPTVANTLRDELQLLMVDEFQDTSPIQLALFLKLARLADLVIWVGDIKQSIYGFRGADPALMSAVVEQVVAEGNPPEILPKSWRSRPELVAYVNNLFVPAFANTLTSEQVQLEPALEATLGTPAVTRWQLQGRNKTARAGAVAQGIGNLMASGREIVDKTTQLPRPLRFGDIAILCRTHDNLAEIAGALASTNLPISYKRAGLLATPEGCLAIACLRRLIDPLDTLATAEIRCLTDCENPEAWLSERLAWLANEDNRSHQWLTSEDGPVARLEAQRERLPFLTPVEALRVAMDAAEVRKSAYRWGPTPQRAQHRLNNLSMLISHAEDYINQCVTQSEPATAAGLVLWFHALAEAEEDTQATGGDEDAIQLVTHHGAKGLEWPIVIAMDLDASLKPRLWGLTVQPSTEPVDLDNPLKNRLLRYWPKFQGAQRSNIPLVDNIEASKEGAAAMDLETEEAKRLLYVSLTRARDGLVLTMNGRADDSEWMNILGADWMLPTEETLSLPDGTAIPAEAQALEAEESLESPPEYQPMWLANAALSRDKLPLYLSPSKALPLEGAKVTDITDLSEPLTIESDYQPDVLGSALHAVIASIINGNEEPKTIERILRDYDMQDNISVDAARECAIRLIAHIESNYEEVSYATECPVQFTNENGQLVSGWIDLLLEAGNGLCIVDHKATSAKDPEEAALAYSGQLESYAEAINRIRTGATTSAMIHSTLRSKVIDVSLTKRE